MAVACTSGFAAGLPDKQETRAALASSRLDAESVSLTEGRLFMYRKMVVVCATTLLLAATAAFVFGTDQASPDIVAQRPAATSPGGASATRTLSPQAAEREKPGQPTVQNLADVQSPAHMPKTARPHVPAGWDADPEAYLHQGVFDTGAVEMQQKIEQALQAAVCCHRLPPRAFIADPPPAGSGLPCRRGRRSRRPMP